MKVPILLFILTIGLFAHAEAQQGLSQRPAYPQASRPLLSCEPGYIWVDASWRWDSATEVYLYQEGHCIKCKRNHIYIPGFWKRRQHKWFWVQGEWIKLKSSGISRSRIP